MTKFRLVDHLIICYMGLRENRRSLHPVPPQRTGAPHLARFSRDVGFHWSFPLTVDSPDALGGQHPWYPTSREKQARCGAPVLCGGTWWRDLAVLYCFGGSSSPVLTYRREASCAGRWPSGCRVSRKLTSAVTSGGGRFFP